MNKQKLISVLQSRIAKRRSNINGCWVYISTLCDMYYPETYYKTKKYAISLGYEQKVDKQLLRQLILDERELKDWKREFNRSLETNRSLEVKMRNYKITGHFLIRGMAN